LGSVAKKVTLHTNVPVLIAREKRHISKILVPIDGSKSAEKALNHATLLAKKTDSKITLLYVKELIISDLKPEAIGALGNHILSMAANQVKGIKIDQKLESGDPAKVIVQTAEKGDYDLIVMGSRGLGMIGRFLLGSVSDHVTQYANRSVLIVK